MIFNYKVLTQEGKQEQGTIDAISQDLAITALQRRGYVVVSVVEGGSKKWGDIVIFDSIPSKDIVMMSRQVSTLFEAQVSASRAFSLLAESSSNPTLRRSLSAVSQDIQGGMAISDAMKKHPMAFSNFYVNMVRAGEESGKFVETFDYLADYLEREFEIKSKTQNALIYPAFVILTFIIVMVLMLVMVIPKLSQILIETGGELPFYTKIVIWISQIFVDYGLFMLIGLVIGGFFFWKFSRGENGKYRIDQLKMQVPYLGDLFRKLYLSRIADNLDTMLSAGIPVVRAMQITGEVVDNQVYSTIMKESVESVKAGNPMSAAFEKHPEFPNILVQMIRVGEESGSVTTILKTVARFYKREMETAVDTLIGLIEPVMIILLGLGVGFLLTSVLLPIYNIASGF
ncbi:MAG: type II secretion system F family protein [Candidatus Pacebacteria bacterium]|nr:type II secretion system F family protein [Candidatus Paceibacterota bacterium]